MTSNEMALMANIAVDMQKNEINKVLKDIKAEITNIPITETDGHNNNWYREPQAIINDVLRIIDKYKVEVEPQESEVSDADSN